MRQPIGNMNIPFNEIYNEEDDVYYVTFKTGEPSYCLEMDDVFLMELGLFTNLPTGFRILNFKQNKIKMVKIGLLLRKIQETLHEIDLTTLGDREARIKSALEEVLAY